mmetsp:Transcript_35793/g.34819  ORF Transcript_35793/g.34819 Transcript_35793/m.34819 type:complete len:97 (+) Transcript_35793:745-1035(+)
MKEITFMDTSDRKNNKSYDLREPQVVYTEPRRSFLVTFGADDHYQSVDNRVDPKMPKLRSKSHLRDWVSKSFLKTHKEEREVVLNFGKKKKANFVG